MAATLRMNDGSQMAARRQVPVGLEARGSHSQALSEFRLPRLQSAATTDAKQDPALAEWPPACTAAVHKTSSRTLAARCEAGDFPLCWRSGFLWRQCVNRSA